MPQKIVVEDELLNSIKTKEHTLYTIGKEEKSGKVYSTVELKAF